MPNEIDSCGYNWTNQDPLSCRDRTPRQRLFSYKGGFISSGRWGGGVEGRCGRIQGLTRRDLGTPPRAIWLCFSLFLCWPLSLTGWLRREGRALRALCAPSGRASKLPPAPHRDPGVEG